MKRSPGIEAVAAEVCTALQRHDVEAILVGGAVVTIYSANQYKSFDLDFVVRGRDADIVKAMTSIGFKKGTGRHFERAGTLYIVEFLNPPPEIGNTLVTSFAVRSSRAGDLTLYDPTHCVMDRLAAFFHWKDRQSLDQAVMVARRHRIRMNEVERWSEGEGYAAGFLEFKTAMKSLKRPG